MTYSICQLSQDPLREKAFVFRGAEVLFPGRQVESGFGGVKASPRRISVDNCCTLLVERKPTADDWL
jgi:hypothetical protein